MDCIFCKIINNEVPSFKVYEDDFVLAFLDINPATMGHTLVIPKKHFENIFDIEDEYLKKIIVVAKKIAEKMKEKGFGGVNFYHASDRVAEQGVFHFHLHVIPRAEGDRIDFTKSLNSISKFNSEDFEAIRNKITLI